MAKQTPEQVVKTQICEWLLTQNCFFYVTQSHGIYDPKRRVFRMNNSRFSCKGLSDIVGIWEGKPLYIEVKAPGKKPSPNQITFLKRVNESGGIGFYADSLETVIEELTSCR